MTNLEERFLNVLEGKIYAIIEYSYLDNKIEMLTKWITYERALTLRPYHYNVTQIFSYLFIWKNGMWHGASWFTGEPLDNDSDNDSCAFDPGNIAQQAFKLLNNDES